MASLIFMGKVGILVFLMSLTSCAYKMGYAYRELPRGIKSLYIPVFKNDTLEVGPEVDFTTQLVREIKRSKVASLLNKETAEGVLQGRIIRITRHQQTHESRERDDEEEEKETGLRFLPRGTYVATEYLLKVSVDIRLKSQKTGRIVWTQRFEDQTVYSTARLSLPGVNTSSANYTSSEEERVIQNLASVMMREAVDRLTENF